MKGHIIRFLSVCLMPRYSKTLDLCYGSIKGTYKSVGGPTLGSSDHNVVHLLPTYKTVLQREQVVKRMDLRGGGGFGLRRVPLPFRAVSSVLTGQCFWTPLMT